MRGDPADNYFPAAHTCFFQLDLPKYSAREIMLDKLRYAIVNCISMDGDDTTQGVRAGAMLSEYIA